MSLEHDGSTNARNFDGQRNITKYNDFSEKLDQYVGYYAKKAADYKRIIFGLLMLSALNVLGWIYIATLPKDIPWVVEVTPWGDAKYAGKLERDGTATDMQRPPQAIEFFLKMYVDKLRSIAITHDLQDGSNEVVSKMSGDISGVKAGDYWSKIEIYGMINRKINRNVENIILLPVSANTVQMTWIEKTFSEGIEDPKPHKFRGIFKVDFKIPSEKQRDKNPLGIFVSDFNIEEESIN